MNCLIIKEFVGNKISILRKKILIVNPGSLYPVVGMNQIRVINQIKSLSQNHDIDLLFFDTKIKSKFNTVRELNEFCKQIIPVKTVTQTFIFSILRKLFLKKIFNIFAIPYEYFSLSNYFSAKRIAKFVDKDNYDIVITHYWQSAGFFKYLKKTNPIRCIDTHYVVEEMLMIYDSGNYKHLNEVQVGKQLPKELLLQNRFFSICDLLIVNSSLQEDLINKSFPDKKVLTIPNGQSLNYYFNFKQDDAKRNNKKILFYGALSNEFNGRAIQRIINNILPKLKIIIPDIQLIILGSSPPQWIRTLNNKGNIIVKGFVDDIRPILAESYLTLIPLESGAGFRGRTIELMAMGVPIIGTHNALDCLNITNGIHSFIIDDDEEIVKQILKLINNPLLRKEISDNEKVFVANNYSLESTFGKLSYYFSNIKIKN